MKERRYRVRIKRKLLSSKMVTSVVVRKRRMNKKRERL